MVKRTLIRRRRALRSMRGNALRQNIPTNATFFRGPLDTTDDSTVVTLYLNATVTASAGGVVSGVFNNDPSNARNWTEYASSWYEYRVLGIRYKYDPNNVVNTATLNGFNGYHSIIHGLANIVPTSLAQAASTGISKPFNAFKPFQREWRMSDTEESVFGSVAAPAATSNTLIVYAENGTANNYYGNISVEFLVQFRTHAY